MRGVRGRAAAAACALAAACSVEPVVIAPATDVRADRGADGLVVVSWARSADDGKGRALVRGYEVLRARAPGGPFAPFRYDKKDRARPSVVDTSGLAGRDYWYVVWALPEREHATVTEPGARAAAARAAGPASRASGAPAPSGRSTLTAETDWIRPREPPRDLRAVAPPRDNGEHLDLTWSRPAAGAVAGYRVLRARTPGGPFTPFPDSSFAADATRARVTVPEIGADYWFALHAVPALGEASPPAVVGPVRSRGALLDTALWALATLILLAGGSLFFFVRQARSRGEKMFIRRIPGIDALEDAVGRATEMGRPVLYVPGVESSLHMQTLATVLVLGHVAERVARYGAKLRVSVNFPMTLPLAQEAVKQGYLNAGRPDAYNPNDVQWISSEQFAFTAGTNGIILREKPATNIYLGRFYAESLILAETGFVNRAIQIAGTAEIPQLPFFVAACDYTLIGEELYAMSAYLSRQPALLGTLKGGDVVKAVAVAALLLGAILGAGGWWPAFVEAFSPVS